MAMLRFPGAKPLVITIIIIIEKITYNEECIKQLVC